MKQVTKDNKYIKRQYTLCNDKNEDTCADDFFYGFMW